MLPHRARLVAVGVLLLAATVQAAKEPKRPLTPASAFVLGSFGEYMGRSNLETDDTVEHFYPNERAEAELVRRALLRVAAEWDLDERLTLSDEQGGHLFMRSPALSAAFNAQYDVHFNAGIRGLGRDDRYHRTARLFVTREMLDPLPRDTRLAYLAGAYARFGDSSDAMTFYNMQHKAIVVARLLHGLGCTDVTIASRPYGIPRQDIVRFHATQRVARWLRDYRPA